MEPFSQWALREIISSYWWPAEIFAVLFNSGYAGICVCVYESIWAAFAWMISEKTEVNSPWIHNACVFVFTYFCTRPSINTCESICNWGCPGPSYYTNQKTHSHRKLKLFVNISLHFINVSLDSLFLIPIKMFFF